MRAVLFLIIAGPALALAQTASRPAEPARDASQTVIDLERRVWQAWGMKDWEAVSVLTAPDYHGLAEDDIWGVEQLKREFAKVNLRSYELGTMRAVPLGPETILLSYRGTVMESFEGRDVSGPYMYTTVWVKRGERWLVLVDQELRTSPVRVGRKHEKQ